MDYKNQIVSDLKRVIGENLSEVEIYNLIEVPKDSSNGDYAFPVFSLSKIFKKAPNIIASDLMEKLKDTNYEKVIVKGGYINFFLKKDLITQEVLREILIEGSNYGASQLGGKRNVPVDMSSPNIAKPMSMGHLRSTVIGNSLALVLEKVGFQPIKINHIGDWGTQFGKLIVAYKTWGSEEKVKERPIEELLSLYVKFHEEAEIDSDLEVQGRLWFKKLEDGDLEAVRLWRWFKEESLKEFQSVYDLLEIEFDSVNGESFYNDKMDSVIEKLQNQSLLQINEGASIVDLSAYNLHPALIKKSDGATLYITRDLAAANYRMEHYDFVEALYVVGNEQSDHFKQLKAVLAEMGNDWSDNIKHIPFGLITSGGKKLSTRKGNIILLEDVLNQAISETKKNIEEKNPALANKDEVARQVGVGAVVFHDLKNDRMNIFDFSIDEVIQSEGETGPYVQYTRTRCMSVLEKANWSLPNDLSHFYFSDAESWEVIKLLNVFPEKIIEAYRKYEPSVLAKYVIDLAQKFNKYYSKVKILEENDEKTTRLALVCAVSIVLKEGLRLLGVASPDKM